MLNLVLLSCCSMSSLSIISANHYYLVFHVCHIYVHWSLHCLMCITLFDRVTVLVGVSAGYAATVCMAWCIL